MLLRLRDRLKRCFGSSRDHAHAASVKLERERAFRAHRAAIARGDTREIHWTRKALTRATTELLRLEVQR